MINGATAILEILKETGNTNAEKLQDVIGRGIPITAMQANLMYLRRGYGKSYMSYILVAQEALSKLKTEDKVIVKNMSWAMWAGEYPIISPSDYDEDVGHRYSRLKNWLKHFEAFIKMYYPELEIESFKGNILTLRSK